MKQTRIVFMGTPEFAVASLRALHHAFTVAAVVTQPDRPCGRGKKLTPPPVKVTAEELGIPVAQPQKIRSSEFVEWLRKLEPDFLVTAAYGKILPPAVLAVPKYFALNIHASLLPRHRGAAPIHRAVLAGDRESGVTIMHMDEGMDTGDMILRETVEIGPHDTTGILHDKLSVLGAKMIVPAIEELIGGTAGRVRQNHEEATLAPPLTREDEEIDWCRKAVEVHNRVRGMNPWPGAYTWLNGERLKIWAGQPAEGWGRPCGAVLSADGHGILIAVADGAFRITRLQPPGKKAMGAADFLRGNALPAGTVLGK